MGQRLALLIHNLRFTHPHLPPLPISEGDVMGLAAVLREPTIGGFDAVTVVQNESLEAVRRHIGRLFYRRRSDDLLFLYMATHALWDEAGRLYLATADTDPNALDATAVLAETITRRLDHTMVRQQVVVLDAHHWGAAAKSVAEVADDICWEFEGSRYGRLVLAATARATTLPAEISFTRTLYQDLHTGAADLSGSGRISVSEWYRAAATSCRQHGIHTNLWRYAQRDDVIIGRNPERRQAQGPWVAPVFAPLNDSPAPVRRPIKWDLVLGGIFSPLTILLIGGQADFGTALSFAAFFALLYICIYQLLRDY